MSEETKETKAKKPPVNKNQADKEVRAWLEHKQTASKKIEDSEEEIDTLIGAICDGNLILDSETFVFTHRLKQKIVPIESGTDVIEILNYKARIQMRDIKLYSKNVKSTDGFGMIEAYICALTGKAAALIACFDTEDNRIARAIATFFL